MSIAVKVVGTQIESQDEVVIGVFNHGVVTQIIGGPGSTIVLIDMASGQHFVHTTPDGRWATPHETFDRIFIQGAS